MQLAFVVALGGHVVGGLRTHHVALQGRHLVARLLEGEHLGALGVELLAQRLDTAVGDVGFVGDAAREPVERRGQSPAQVGHFGLSALQLRVIGAVLFLQLDQIRLASGQIDLDALQVAVGGEFAQALDAATALADARQFLLAGLGVVHQALGLHQL